MKKEVVLKLHASFDELVQEDEQGEFWLARDLQMPLGYSKWENFEGVIRRAVQLIANGTATGFLTKCQRDVAIGSRAVRKIIDYRCDSSAVELLGLLTTSFKLNGYFLARNESVVLGLLAKWASGKGITARPQFQLNGFKFDLMLDDKVLIEFDEPHHSSSRQKAVDVAKATAAQQAGFELLRFDLNADVVDAILAIELLICDDAHVAMSHAEQIVQRARLTAKADALGDEITNFNIKRDELRTETRIADEHVKNNKDVRELLMQRGIQPESLPGAEDIRKIERRVASEAKKLPATQKKLGG
jgi:DNA-damage-inducible protein D